MSELKDYSILDIEAIDDERLEKSESGRIQETRVYLKFEADKVIADLIEKNKRLAHKDAIMASETIKDLFKELRHHKYKRCLAMAKWCKSMMVFNDRYGAITKWSYYKRWHNRWLELAEKFKEAK